MADKNGNPWDFDDSGHAWNPSEAPTSSTGDASKGKGASSKNDVPAAHQPNSIHDAPTTSIPPTSTTGAGAPTTRIQQEQSNPDYPYIPAPEFGAKTSDPNKPLPASSYPFGAPPKPDKSKKQNQQSQNNAGNQNSNPFNPFGFGGMGGGNNQQNQNGQQTNNGGFNSNPNGSAQPGGPAGPTGPSYGAPAGPNNSNNGNLNNNTGNNKSQQPVQTGMSRTWIAAIASALIAALLVLGLGYAAIANGVLTLPSSGSTTSMNSSSGGSGTAKVDGGKAPDWAAVNKKVAGSVVSISSEVSGGVAKGSGAIIDTNGDIATNNHVIEGAKQIQVSLSNGKIYDAKVVGTDTTTDLAVIKLNNPPSDLQPVTFANSDNLAVGESVMAIGNPLGYENTATTGIVSALNRPVSVTDESSKSEIVTNAIQIDASINPGNSGGPTFNAAGQVVGINSSIATASQSSSSSDSESGSIGIGFAIPSVLVQRVSQQIVKSGKATHAQLGVTITNGSATVDGAGMAGAQVKSVVSGGPSATAGLKEGDVIVGFNGNVVNSMYSLLGYVRAAAVGDTVKVTVVRNSKTLDVQVKLSEAEAASSSNSNKNNDNNDDNNDNNDNNDGSGNGDDDGSGNDGFSDPFDLFGGQ